MQTSIKPGIKGKKMEKKKTLEIKVVHTQPGQTEKLCPFGKLACKDCRLFIQIPGFKGEFECAFILAAVR